MNRVQIAYAGTLAGYFGLLLTLFAWITWLQPPTVLPISLVLVFLVGPLLFPLRGLLDGRPYTFAWTSLLALFYLVYGIVEAYSSPPERALALTAVGFSALLYGGALLYTRLRSRQLKGN